MSCCLSRPNFPGKGTPLIGCHCCFRQKGTPWKGCCPYPYPLGTVIKGGHRFFELIKIKLYV